MSTTTVKMGRKEIRHAEPINNLRALRSLCGLTLGDLATYLEVEPPVISQAELHRTSSLGKANWYRLADFFNLDPRILEGMLPIPADYVPPALLQK